MSESHLNFYSCSFVLIRGWGIILCDPIFIVSAGDIPHPVLIVEIPLDGFANTGFEGFLRLPAKFAVDFRGVDGVAAVVPGRSVPHFVIFCSSKAGRSFFEKLTMATYPFEEQS